MENPKIIDPNWFDYISASWLNPMMKLSYKNQLTDKDLYQLKAKDKADYIAGKFSGYWERFERYTRDRDSKPNLYWHLTKAIFWPFVGSVISNFTATGLNVLQPLLLQQMILFMEGNTDKLLVHDGWIIASAIVGMQITKSLSFSYEYLTSRRHQQIIHSLLVTAIYQKSLRLSLASRVKFPAGKIINLVNQDVEAVKMAVAALENTLIIPPEIVFTMYFLYLLIGNALFVAFGVLGLIAIISAFISPKIGRIYTKWIEAGDKRLSIVREMLYAIKVVKFETLENFFMEKIGIVRKDQVNSLKKEFLYNAGLEVVVSSSVVIMIASSFALYSILGNEMHPSIIFPAILYFMRLEDPLSMISWFLSSCIAGYNSMARLSEFFLADEMQLDRSIAQSGSGKVHLRNATLKWELVEKDESLDETSLLLPENSDIDTNFKLTNINLDIKPGTIVGIIGAVGSGKSTLLSSIIGEVKLVKGTLSTSGKIAYCSQQPWILTGSVEKNILFNKEKDQNRLDLVVKMCGLEKDLALLQNGLHTQIGENGVNLSGGQKARISLARSIYADADIYLLDDPLAALDAHVGKEVFFNAILELLKSKTVLLVTHQIQYMNQLDRIIVMDDGKIVEAGSFKELAKQDGKFTHLIESHAIEDLDDKRTIEQQIDTKNNVKTEEVQNFIAEEEMNEGRVAMSVYSSYFKAVGGILLPSAFIVLFLVVFAIKIVNPLWLAAWTSNTDSASSTDYLVGYATLSAFEILFSGLFQVITLFLSIQASCTIHDTALERVLNAPLSFFDRNPIGRILNRFSSDVEKLDRNVGFQLLYFSLKVIAIISSVILICTASKYIILMFILVAVCCYNWFLLFRPSNLDFQRMLSVSNSPLDAHISESLLGIAVIRAYKQESTFMELQMKLLDKVLSLSYLKQSLSIWFRFRVNMMATATTALVVYVASQSKLLAPEYVAILSLALTYVTTLPWSIMSFFMIFGYFESSMNAVERLTHYADNLPEEKQAQLETDPSELEWPIGGDINIRNLQICYPSRPDYAVISNLSLSIKAGEKIGVVGRTGSGKSTLAASLFRIVEPTEGSIIIDGIGNTIAKKDVCQLGIRTLRKRIQMIPQDPILFEGTFRSNLDVEGLYSEDNLWQALEHSGLKSFVSGLAGKLDSPITANGENLSVGQRQLVCLSRAILTRPKVIVMDEATASVDRESDLLIQRAIKTHFRSTTVISIAHRLNTIADFDKVLVLDHGEKVEFDRPSKLLQNPDSFFAHMAAATGKNNLQTIIELANLKIQ
ncbi:Multidrug resistance-associated protein 1 [Terramyces sp. JEL0728]|nr:Multidrug resistance-associated protein 1 [Terramyces sp. JEL0728]